MPPAPATQAIANEQAAEQRKRLLAQRLAAQMAAKSAVQGATSRSQSVGLPFGSAAYGRAGAVPLLSLGADLAAGRLRPAGFDASAPATIVPAGAIATGPGLSAASSDLATLAPTDSAAAPATTGQTQQPSSQPMIRIDGPPGTAPTSGGSFNSDTPLTAQPPTPLPSLTPPDPYTVMAQILMQRKLALAAQYPNGNAPIRYGGAQLQ